MKVFKMNDYDWVVAVSMAEAIEWYERVVGSYWPEEERNTPTEYYIDDDNEINSVIKKVLEMNKKEFPKQREPYIILSARN